MELDKFQQTREGETCRGVIKKLFPSKRYGFAVCECAKHTGEAHFNYSDLDLPEQERSCLVVGWRIEFNVIEQHKKTDHCDYRAIQVKPVDVMVVQCEVSEVWENEIAILTCRELTGKVIYVTRNKYNGKFESEAAARPDTCRAAVTWEQMKQKKTFALHCSQDTVTPTTASPYRPKFKTPEKRTRRGDSHNFSESALMNSSSRYTDDIFFCDRSEIHVPRTDSGLVSPEDHQGSALSSRSFGGLRVLTSTPKTDTFESGRFSASSKTTPHAAHGSNKINRANSTGSVGSSGISVSGHSYGNKFPGSGRNVSHGKSSINIEDLKNSSSMKGSETASSCSGGGGALSLFQSSVSTGDSFKDNRSGSSRRNLDREFESFYGNLPERKMHNSSPTRNPVYPESTGMVSMLSSDERNFVDEECHLGPVKEQRRYCSDSVFGLYDANSGNDEVSIYSVLNKIQSSPRPSWGIALSKSSASNLVE